jgi:hypothetical protein
VQCCKVLRRRGNRKTPESEKGQDTWTSEFEAKQRNRVWPDTMRNSRVDVLFFKRNPNAPMVQRVGCWVFSTPMFFITATAIAEMMNSRNGSWVVVAVASPEAMAPRCYLAANYRDHRLYRASPIEC